MTAYTVNAVYDVNEPRRVFSSRRTAFKASREIANRIHGPVAVFKAPRSGIITANDEIARASAN